MTYLDETKKAGRPPLIVADLKLDFCGETFGISPCLATGAAGTECYNTWATCQYTPAYNPLSTEPIGLFTNRVPVNVPGLEFDTIANRPPIYPCITNVKFSPAAITPGKGFGSIGKITIKCQDFPGSPMDFWQDRYWTTRPSKAGLPANQGLPGTFWSRLLARHRYYNGRQLIVYIGYDEMPDGSTSTYPTDFEQRIYLLENITGPDGNGNVTITAKDPLELSSDTRATCPKPVSGTLKYDLSATQSISFQIVETGKDFESGLSVVRIDEELISYITFTTGTGTFSLLARGAYNTTAAAHDAGASVQQAKRITSDNVVDVIEELLTYYTDIPSIYINPTYLDFENWLQSVYVAATIAEPVGVRTLIAELADQCQFDIWYDERLQVIRLRAVAPRKPQESYIEITDDTEIISKSATRKIDESGRVSRVFMYYGEINPLKGTDPGNYARLYVAVNSDSESSNAYGTTRERSINSRWLSADQSANVVASVGRIVGRLGESPETIRFLLDAKDSAIETGDHVQITSRLFQGPDGLPLSFEALITKIGPEKLGHNLVCEAIDLRFATRYAYIAVNSAVDYASASPGEKLIYGYIAPNSGNFADGGVPYRII